MLAQVHPILSGFPASGEETLKKGLNMNKIRNNVRKSNELNLKVRLFSVDTFKFSLDIANPLPKISNQISANQKNAIWTQKILPALLKALLAAIFSNVFKVLFQISISGFLFMMLFNFSDPFEDRTPAFVFQQ